MVWVMRGGIKKRKILLVSMIKMYGFGRVEEEQRMTSSKQLCKGLGENMNKLAALI